MKILFLLMLISNLVTGQLSLGELRGAVVDTEGESLPFVRVFVYASGSDFKELRRGVETDIDGRFRITGLDSGSYNLEIVDHVSGAETTRLTAIDVKADQITHILKIEMRYMEVICCDFGIPYSPSIQLDPFGGPTIIEKEDIRRP